MVISIGMENFFNNSNNLNFSSGQEKKLDPDKKVELIKNHYQQYFAAAIESLRREVNSFRPENACDNCNVKECKLRNSKITPFLPFPQGCKYREWQMQIINFLAGDYKQKLRNTYKNIIEKKSEHSCAKCGSCCRLSVSKYSITQLKQKALKGDKYAQDFVNIYIPYQNENEAKLANPEYFDLLNKLVTDEKIYYYHCTKLDSNNLCSDYEHRPNICKEYPNNPIQQLPSTCSYNAWLKQVEKDAMMLQAKTDLIEFYKQKLG